MEAQDQTRIEKRIEEIKSNMWDRLPPTYLPYGKLVIDTNPEFLQSQTITFDIPSRSTDVIDESGDFGIRKTDSGLITIGLGKLGVKWQIYETLNGSVIKESHSYSRFFDGFAWDDVGTEGTEGTTLTSSKKYPVTIHEVIDGTVRSAKDIAYKYPQIFSVQWWIVPEIDPDSGKISNVLNLGFRIREDKELGPCSYLLQTPGSELPSDPITVLLLDPEPSPGKPGIYYTWSYNGIQFMSGTIVSFHITIDGKVTKLETTYIPSTGDPTVRPPSRPEL